MCSDCTHSHEYSHSCRRGHVISQGRRTQRATPSSPPPGPPPILGGPPPGPPTVNSPARHGPGPPSPRGTPPPGPPPINWGGPVPSAAVLPSPPPGMQSFLPPPPAPMQVCRGIQLYPTVHATQPVATALLWGYLHWTVCTRLTSLHGLGCPPHLTACQHNRGLVHHSCKGVVSTGSERELNSRQLPYYPPLAARSLAGLPATADQLHAAAAAASASHCCPRWPIAAADGCDAGGACVSSSSSRGAGIRSASVSGAGHRG